ncbi:hypothetical protein L6164_000808 [Bauhinia variegata]|uniref:Uncharacterized protein n=1 Tax=Bauhinia variegata TaxID=167791 RepID=A0ACB9QAC4_BAUVA|nr:hypothetical protein L6164_000808 [Bauhinia variegata]
MEVEDESPGNPRDLKPLASPSEIAKETSAVKLPRAPSHADLKPTDTSPEKELIPRDFILSAASEIASQPLQYSDPEVWGVLTAISIVALKRPQGINILLIADEHCIGRVVEDVKFQIDSNAVSAKHCRIYRMKVTDENMQSSTSIFLKDTSTNGTYINWEKLNKNSPAVKVCHGDIISFATPPHYERAFAFVYRDVLASTPMPDNAVIKRKTEELLSENKRLKGIGIGAPEGPISLDDFRSLQRSNTELRKQLENQVVLIDTLRNENCEAVERHETELKYAKESVSKCYLDQLTELQKMVDLKQKELGEVNRVSAEQKHAIEDLNERLSASMQSCAEANAIISSQTANITELKEQLDEERSLRKEEQEKAASDLKAAVHRVQSEAQEEFKRLSDTALRREKELQESINKLQESERERCLLVETLRSKLENIRQKLVVSDIKARELETQVQEEQLACTNSMTRVNELEQETGRLRKELESGKATREEAWAKASALELEINVPRRDLDFERRRLKAARERIMLRETQLRAFYSTTEEIQVLFAKQQEQLKSMQRTLEDEENYENASVDMDVGQEKVEGNRRSTAVKAGSTASAQQNFDRDWVETSSDGASVTEKHDCDIRSQECQDTQEAEFTSADHEHGKRAASFGSNIDGVGRAPTLEGDAIGTGQVLETESPSNYGELKFDLNKSGALDGDTMQVDDDVNVQDTEEQGQTACKDVAHHSRSNHPADTQKIIEDTETGGTIRTADLLASEVAGSWANSTAPSVHGENESPRSRDNNLSAGPLHDSTGMVAESQSTPSSGGAAGRRTLESEMIGIVAPDMREHFGRSADDSDREREKHGASCDSETESCSDTGHDGVNAKGGSISDAETEGSDHVEDDQKQDDTLNEDMDEDDDTT